METDYQLLQSLQGRQAGFLPLRQQQTGISCLPTLDHNSPLPVSRPSSSPISSSSDWPIPHCNSPPLATVTRIRLCYGYWTLPFQFQVHWRMESSIFPLYKCLFIIIIIIISIMRECLLERIKPIDDTIHQNKLLIFKDPTTGGRSRS